MKQLISITKDIFGSDKLSLNKPRVAAGIVFLTKTKT